MNQPVIKSTTEPPWKKLEELWSTRKRIFDTALERTKGALALAPVGNKEGSWYYLVLSTWRVIKRNWSEALPMPVEVANRIH